MALFPLGILSAAGVSAAVRVAVAGYFAGGEPSARTTTVEKFAFPADTRSTLATGLSSARENMAGFADSGVAGYSAGGDTSSGRSSTVDKFAFPSDTRSTLGTGLATANWRAAGMSNQGVF